MARPKHKIEVDGLAYWVVQCGPFDALRLDALGAKAMGPLFRALASSESAREIIKKMFKGGEKEFGAELDRMLDGNTGEIMMALGLSLDDLLANFGGEELIEAVGLLVIGKVSGPYLGAPEVLIEDVGTYEDIIGAAMDKHGHMHQLKLLWACARANLGPTTAGRSTDSPAS
jgi:hypothetical protein